MVCGEQGVQQFALADGCRNAVAIGAVPVAIHAALPADGGDAGRAGEPAVLYAVRMAAVPESSEPAAAGACEAA